MFGQTLLDLIENHPRVPGLQGQAMLRLDAYAIIFQLSLVHLVPQVSGSPAASHACMGATLPGYHRASGDRQTPAPSLITLLTLALTVLPFEFFFCFSLLAQHCPKCSRHFHFFMKTMCFFALTHQDTTAAANDYLKFWFLFFFFSS